MPTTDPLTGATIYAQTDAALGGQQLGDVVTDLRPYTVPRFATTAARDTAYASYVAAGGVLVDGMLCVVDKILQERDGGVWGAPPRPGILLQRTTSVPVSNNSGENQGFTAANAVSDRGGFYNGTTADAMKIPAGMGGNYLISINSTMSAVIQARHLAILTTGTAGGELFRANGAFNDTAHAGAVVPLNAGATLGIKLFHQFGSTVNNIALSVSMYLIGR